MEITINDQRKIFAIQKEFNDMFPFLRLDFYAKSNKGGGAPAKKMEKHISKSIAQCRTTHSSGHLTIQSQMTIGELEQGFRDVYGLSIEVFCKSADEWVAAIGARADETLEKRNAEGKEANKIYKITM
jgi:hypothetical protein